MGDFVLAVGRVFIKDETARFDLPSFKILGASWAAYAALAERLGPMPAFVSGYRRCARSR